MPLNHPAPEGMACGVRFNIGAGSVAMRGADRVEPPGAQVGIPTALTLHGIGLLNTMQLSVRGPIVPNGRT